MFGPPRTGGEGGAGKRWKCRGREADGESSAECFYGNPEK